MCLNTVIAEQGLKVNPVQSRVGLFPLPESGPVNHVQQQRGRVNFTGVIPKLLKTDMELIEVVKIIRERGRKMVI